MWGGVYGVSDRDALRIQRHVKLFWLAALVIVAGLQVVLGWRYNLLALAVLLGGYFGMARLHMRHLPRLALSVRELASISRPNLERRYSPRGWGPGPRNPDSLFGGVCGNRDLASNEGCWCTSLVCGGLLWSLQPQLVPPVAARTLLEGRCLTSA